MKKSRILLILSIAAVLLVGAVGTFVYFNSTPVKLNKQLDLGRRYLEECDYEQARIAFEQAIEIDPMSAEAYLGLCEVYLGVDDLELAKEAAQRGYDATKDERLKKKLEEICDELERIRAEQEEAQKEPEVEEWVNELTELNQMMIESSNGVILSWDDVRFFGALADGLSMEHAKMLLQENGYTYEEASELGLNYEEAVIFVKDADHQSCMSVWADKTEPCMITQIQYNGNSTPTGIYGIRTGQSLEEVLTEMGIGNTGQITERVMDLKAKGSIKPYQKVCVKMGEEKNFLTGGYKEDCIGFSIEIQLHEQEKWILIEIDFNDDLVLERVGIVTSRSD